ncbi:GGDEF domain-containing protein [Salinisphaera hydrothermalis]|uniref:diguanylate cyclase n=1 Tax=Salinisphaera hydrothermalis (strain C41B8) TaxID=1304275 RepID=A0A084IN80_SALHC|nr:GGDEF domain-containing protein [Salinisphaera hydrothermalis]KEZ78164.1 diguanylate cyclase [Salinisphaera hydrothermalis C41B8]
MSLAADARRTTAHAAFWMMTRRVTILAASVDIVFFVFFLWAGSPLLAWLNVLSVGLYGAANRLLVWRWNRSALLLIWLEVIGHAVIGSLCVGWDAGFNYYLLMFIPAIMVSGDWPRVAAPLAMLFAIYLGLHAVSNQLGPLVPIDDTALALLNVFNVSIFFAMASYTARFYYLLVRRTEGRLREHATRDTLTQLFNRRHLLEIAEGELARARRDDTSLSLVIVDIDHFKQINDELGHDVGDRVLVHVSGLFQACCRASDTVARWGGEEFLFLLPNTDIEAALDFARRVRVAVARHPLVPKAPTEVACTVSLGVASLAPGETLEAAIVRADRALYESKMAGRNRVTPAPAAAPEVPLGEDLAC